MRVLQVAGGLLRASITVAMQYRTDFVLDGATGLLRAFAAVAPVILVFDHRPEVAGWTSSEVTTVVGLYFVMQGLLAGFVEPNLGEIVESIRQGTLDFLLLKPADAQLLASVRRLAPGRLWDLLVGIGLLGWSFATGVAPHPVDLLVAALLLASGLGAMYGIWLIAICASFWFVRVDNLRFLLWAVTDAGRWPLDVFSRWVQVALVVVVPVGVLTTFPAMALRGTWSAPMVALGCAVGAAFLLGSRFAWTRALATYTSASS